MLLSGTALTYEPANEDTDRSLCDSTRCACLDALTVPKTIGAYDFRRRSLEIKLGIGSNVWSG